ncbi:MAG: hypothetical protein LBP76_02685 [Treponema sp.]|jgi:hypothetical protein|nr:hypothetical protein [Treponema sp.]
MSNKRIPVWVNGECCDGLKAAAERVRLLSGKQVNTEYLSQKIRKCGAMVYKGIAISTASPEPEELPELPVVKEPEKERPTTQRRRPLLRYPPGEAPIERGLYWPEP